MNTRLNGAAVLCSDGSPGLYLDGEKTAPVLYGLSDFPAARSNTAQAQRNIAAFAAQGISLVAADSCLHLGWRKAHPFDPEPLRAELAGVLDANPQAKILLRLHLNPPYWWLRDHPEECVLYGDTPGKDDGESPRLIRDDVEGYIRVSLASQRWLEEAGACLRDFCRLVRDTPEGRHLLGIQMACGVYGEWHQWGLDCSAPMRARFHRMLREEYPSDRALREAWGDDSVTRDTARFVPDPARPGDDGVFRDPVTARDTMDAQRCLQQTPPEAILHFCRIAKESWGRPILTGAFYGYFLGCGGDLAVVMGHLCPELLYARRELLDFLCGPAPYLRNREPDGVPMSRGLMESTRLRGMLWLTEMDQHPAGTETHPGGEPSRRDETVFMLRRNTLLPLTAGMGFWYYDHRVIPSLLAPGGDDMAGSIYRKRGWWDEPTLMAEIGRLQRLAEEMTRRPYAPEADVLVVYQPKSRFARSRFCEREVSLHEALSRSGAAYDCVYLPELPLVELGRYRCVIFPDACLLRPEERREIRTLCRGKQVVWLHAPGYSDGRTLDAAHIAAACGIAVRPIPTEMAYDTVGDTLPPAHLEAADWDFSPLFSPDDPNAEVLARFTGSGACAAARKGDDWFFALPELSAQLLREIFRRAGAHLWCLSGDSVMAGGGVAVLCCRAGGSRELLLKNGRRVQHLLPPFTTAVFDVTDGRRLL